MFSCFVTCKAENKHSVRQLCYYSRNHDSAEECHETLRVWQFGKCPSQPGLTEMKGHSAKIKLSRLAPWAETV